MFYEYSPTYKKEFFPSHKNMFPDKTYFLYSFSKNSNKIKSFQIEIESLYSEQSPVKSKKHWYAKIFVYKKQNLFQKLFKIQKKIFIDSYILLDYINENKQEALKSFLLMTTGFDDKSRFLISNEINKYADEYPEVYLKEFLNKNQSIRCSHPPLYNYEEIYND